MSGHLVGPTNTGVNPRGGDGIVGAGSWSEKTTTKV